jgi:hypothetical protein
MVNGFARRTRKCRAILQDTTTYRRPKLDPDQRRKCPLHQDRFQPGRQTSCLVHALVSEYQTELP